MKKTLMTCLAIAALFAIAGSASAITCTIDQRPAATLLVPYFEATFNPDGTPLGTGTDARDTLVTICNASSAPMIAHANVFNERTELVLDFNIALTGFDCQSMSMARTLQGFLPATPVTTAHSASANDACQRNPNAGVYSPPVVTGEYLRIRPVDTATDLDNTLATTLYPQPAWPAGSDFAFGVLDSLDATDDSIGCGGVDGTITNPIHGYMVIDHANYCNLSNPSDPLYYSRDAIGMENNLFGEVIFTSGSGLPTFGNSTVNIEADPSLAGDVDTDIRTFYHRYVGTDVLCSPGNCPLFVTNPWNEGIGDQREPLGLKYAARWFNTGSVTSNLNVWRASSGSLTDLLDGGDCDTVEPVVTLSFYDEDENTVLSGVCPSPCRAPSFNFEFETQRRAISTFSGSLPAFAVGWVSMSFFNSAGPNGGRFDQAWVEYDFEGPSAFISAGQPATQLDPSNCNPLGVTGVVVVAPAIPTVVGTGP
ncbi:MAG TPA: hypothetical protein VGA31_05395 [Thermoanaerobaculia bacterium]